MLSGAERRDGWGAFGRPVLFQAFMHNSLLSCPRKQATSSHWPLDMCSMEKQMAKFLVENLSDRVIGLGIEPWADLEVLAPKARVTFEYTEPAEIEGASCRDGSTDSLSPSS